MDEEERYRLTTDETDGEEGPAEPSPAEEDVSALLQAPEDEEEVPAEEDTEDLKAADEPDGDAEEDPAEQGSKAQPEKTISADLIRGHINTIILRALYDGDKYGYEIIAEIEKKSHGQYSMKQPSLYSALKRLEAQGYVTSYWGGSVSGGRRKYFALTDAGREISERNQSEWEYSRSVIDSLISEKQFDFSRPAPTAVDMRVLKQGTSRVPSRETGSEELYYDDGDESERIRLEEERARAESSLAAERAALEEKRMQAEQELAAERARLEEEREALLAQMQEKEDALEAERRTAREETEARRIRLEEEREQLRMLREEQDREREALRESLDEERKTQRENDEQELARREQALKEQQEALDAEKAAYEETLARQQHAAAAERAQLELRIAEREKWLADERERHARELEEQEKRVREEQEKEFAARERQLIHDNYLRLINSPHESRAEGGTDYDYYTPPVAEETAQPPAEEYRSVVGRLYSNSVPAGAPAAPAEAQQPRVQSLGRIDFYDLESRAAADGIKISTAGGGSEAKETRSESVFHKGKVLFFSAIVVFAICIIEGSIVLALTNSLAIPLFYPYFIWATGLALLLVTGLAYANRYGERTLRQTGNFLINCSVIYVLLVIFTLVLALAVKIDFTDPAALATFVIIPVVYFLNVVFFAIAYVLQVKKGK